MNKRISLLLISLLSLTQAQTAKKCHALVMSGGANKGAYTAGVIHGLSHLLNETDGDYDVVSGVSAGSLNAAAMAMWPLGKPREMSEWLVDVARTLNQGMVFQMWPGGLEQGLFDERGIVDSTPLLNTLT